MSNIRGNQGKDSVNDEHIKFVCRKMLDDAKVMYKSSVLSRDSSPYDYSDSEVGYIEGRYINVSIICVVAVSYTKHMYNLQFNSCNLEILFYHYFIIFSK